MEKLNQKGFTLLETLVAVIVLSTCLVTVIQVFSSNLKTLPVSERYTRAVFMARSLMEQVLLADTFAPGRTEGNTELTQDPDSDKNSEADSSFDAEGDTFSWVITVTGVPPDGADETNKKFVTKESASDSFELFRIDLQVMWQDGDKEKSYEISTLVKPKK